VGGRLVLSHLYLAQTLEREWKREGWRKAARGSPARKGPGGKTGETKKIRASLFRNEMGIGSIFYEALGKEREQTQEDETENWRKEGLHESAKKVEIGTGESTRVPPISTRTCFS